MGPTVAPDQFRAGGHPKTWPGDGGRRPDRLNRALQCLKQGAASPENALGYAPGYLVNSDPRPVRTTRLGIDGVLAPQPGADAGRDRVGCGGAQFGRGASDKAATVGHDAAVRSCRARQVL